MPASAPAALASACAMVRIGDPDIDFVALAGGFGVEGCRVDTAEGLAAALVAAFGVRDPRLIEAVLPSFDMTAAASRS